MPLIAAVWGAVQFLLGSWIAKALLYLGISYYTYQGMDLLVASIQQISFQTLSGAMSQGVAPQLAGLFGLMRLGEAFNVYFSAFTASLVLKGLTNSSITKMVLK